MFELPYWKVFAEGYTASWFETVFMCAVNLVLGIGAAILFMLWRHAVKELKHLKDTTKSDPRGKRDEEFHHLSD